MRLTGRATARQGRFDDAKVNIGGTWGTVEARGWEKKRRIGRIEGKNALLWEVSGPRGSVLLLLTCRHEIRPAYLMHVTWACVVLLRATATSDGRLVDFVSLLILPSCFSVVSLSGLVLVLPLPSRSRFDRGGGGHSSGETNGRERTCLGAAQPPSSPIADEHRIEKSKGKGEGQEGTQESWLRSQPYTDLQHELIVGGHICMYEQTAQTYQV